MRLTVELRGPRLCENERYAENLLVSSEIDCSDRPTTHDLITGNVLNTPAK